MSRVISVLFMYLLSTSLIFSSLYAQESEDEKKVISLTIQEVVDRARQQSPSYLQAKHRVKGSYWQYRTFRANYLPGVSLTTTVLDFSNSIKPVTLEDQVKFQSTKVYNSTLTLNINQNVGLTGGQLFINSDLRRLDYEVDSSREESYISSPFVIGYTQPVFAFNSYKWEKRIEPLKYDEARRRYLEELEVVSITATNLFFDMYQAVITLDNSVKNQANNDTLYKISQGRYNLGKIAQNELLQMELALLNSNMNVSEAELQVQVDELDLRNYLGIKEDVVIQLIPPTEIPEFKADVDKAIEQANLGRQKVVGFTRRLLEARRDIAKAQGDYRFSANLFGTFGLTKLAENFSSSFNSLDQRQQVIFGVTVPLLDWGKGKGQIQLARSNYELVKSVVEQEEIEFEQEIFLRVMQFNMQSEQLRIAIKADTIGQKRYFVSKQRYLIGKIGITELNIASSEKDMARAGYVRALRDYWTDYYEIRRMTLYDFEKGRQIEFDNSVVRE